MTICSDCSKGPIDGGYGWVIVAAVFFITFNSFGAIYSIGIIFDVLIAEFDCTKSEVSVVASIALCLQCFLGPFVSIMQERIQARYLVVIGSVITAIALVSSAFAPSVFVLYFTFGLLGGVGIALIYLPVMVLVSFYFDRYRSVAVALSGIGAYVGCFIHPYLIRYLISFYNWRGALFLLGAVELNSIAAALLLRPLNNAKTETSPSPEAQVAYNEENGELPSAIELEKVDSSKQALDALICENVCERGALLHSVTETEEEPTTQHDGTMPVIDDKVRFTIQTQSSVKAAAEQGSVIEVSSVRNENDSPRLGLPSTDSFGSLKRRGVLPKPPSLAQRQMSERLESAHVIMRRTSAPTYEKQQSETFLPAAAAGSTINALDIICPTPLKQSLANNEQSQSIMPRSISNIYGSGMLDIQIASSSAINRPRTPASLRRQPMSRQRMISCESESSKKGENLLQKMASDVVDDANSGVETQNMELSEFEDTSKPCTCDKVIQVLKSYFVHFANIRFTLFFASNFLKGLIYYTPSMFIVGWGTQLGIPIEQTTFLMSLVGIGNILGRPVMAFFGDMFARFRAPLLAGMVAINSVVTLFTPLFPNFYYLAFFVFQFAFLVGGGQTLLTPLLADMVPLSELSFVFGLLIAAEGAAILIGPPLLGLFPTYELTISAAGLIMLSSSLVLFASAYVDKLLALCQKLQHVNQRSAEASKV